MAFSGLAEAVDAVHALERWGHERGWQGSDPYDGLNAGRIAPAITRSAGGRRVLTQVVKRCPVDLRPVLAIPPGRSAAALALVASSYAIPGPWEESVRSQRLRDTLDLLWESRSQAFDEPCWGYHFDVQTRVFFYPRQAPNTIATAFAGHAFLDAYEHGGERRWLEVAAGTAEFFLKRVTPTEAPQGLFFGYLAKDRTPIHNASLLACSLLARLGQHNGEDELSGLARSGVQYVLAHQRPDGSWPYGEAPHLAWVDNFHTGYVLEALMRCRNAGIPGTDNAIERGLRFFAGSLFRDDGAPRYRPSSVFPIDIQCVAQGVQTFALASEFDPTYFDWAWRVARFGLHHMRRRDGAFVFQRRRFWVNRTPHVRWSQAPMLLALTRLIGVVEP